MYVCEYYALVFVSIATARLHYIIWGLASRTDFGVDRRVQFGVVDEEVLNRRNTFDQRRLN